jgi:hypothetical protein
MPFMKRERHTGESPDSPVASPCRDTKLVLETDASAERTRGPEGKVQPAGLDDKNDAKTYHHGPDPVEN